LAQFFPASTTITPARKPFAMVCYERALIIAGAFLFVNFKVANPKGF
jgi:hypothetical protein